MSKMNLLAVALCLNVAATSYLGYRLYTLSYSDIHDAPVILYANKQALGELAARKGEEEGKKYLSDLQNKLQEQHGMIIDEDAIIISSKEFKLSFPKSKQR